MKSDFNKLIDYIDMRINHEKELREQQKKESDLALTLAKESIDIRLHAANETKAIIIEDRGKYFTRDLHEKSNEIIDSRLKNLEMVASNMQGRLWMFMFLASAIAGIISVLIRIYK